MELSFGEFDLILGMDWLVKHHANLDCTAKRMAEKLVRKGCEAFLAYVSTSEVKSLSVGDVRTVKEFPDVFPEELPGFPPNVRSSSALRFYREQLQFPSPLTGWHRRSWLN
ncbi:hypothetical protein EPI10_015344 [Gossypium australe]|uniref:Uncharacterized protein n=1 Tax=Gossypium australe TaxID=47621 RepID=A0A5B6VK04_9ROSI|nr:hypothetical protein EPI10_015344 [Gossypium australe]